MLPTSPQQVIVMELGKQHNRRSGLFTRANL